jgi:uncharacterized membrane protein YidH (DUF202 family)
MPALRASPDDPVHSLSTQPRAHASHRYLTGCAIHHAAAVTAVPDWLPDPSLQHLLHPEIAPPPLAIENAAMGRTEGGAPPISRLPAASTTHAGVACAVAIGPCASPAAGAESSPMATHQPRRALPILRQRGAGRAAEAPRRRTALISRAVPADPKVFFANERTFIQWLSAGMMMLSVGIALIEFRAAQRRTELSLAEPLTAETDSETGATVGELPSTAGAVAEYASGLLVCSMALVIIGYGLAIYVWRLRKLRRKDAAGYSDPFGPPILVVAVYTAVIIYITAHVSAGSSASNLPTNELTSAD